MFPTPPPPHHTRPLSSNCDSLAPIINFGHYISPLQILSKADITLSHPTSTEMDNDIYAGSASSTKSAQHTECIITTCALKLESLLHKSGRESTSRFVVQYVTLLLLLSKEQTLISAVAHDQMHL